MSKLPGASGDYPDFLEACSNEEISRPKKTGHDTHNNSHLY